MAPSRLRFPLALPPISFLSNNFSDSGMPPMTSHDIGRLRDDGRFAFAVHCLCGGILTKSEGSECRSSHSNGFRSRHC